MYSRLMSGCGFDVILLLIASEASEKIETSVDCERSERNF
jgi:hypothetical protein